MPNTRDIRNRIKSIKKTAQITRAMQLVAASKMKRAQDKALQGRSYARLLVEILSALSSRVRDFKHPFLAERPVKSRGIIVLSSDKGLCGPFNANLFRLISDVEKSAHFVSIGNRGTQFLSRSGRQLIADFTISDQSAFSELRPALEFVIKAFKDGKIDTLEVIYSRFVNTLVQKPMRVPLLPLVNLKTFVESLKREEGQNLVAEDSREMLFEPKPQTILNELLSLYIKKSIFQMVLETKASEHSARMVAMKTATDNAKELIDKLTLEYNKVRQASITQEILEIGAANFNA